MPSLVACLVGGRDLGVVRKWRRRDFPIDG